MSRPFRFEKPSFPGPAVVRARLLEQVARRWECRAVSIVAGPGFGKTTLLVAAMQQDAPPGARDIWLCCEPADASADNLCAGLAHALGLAPGASVEEILDDVWASAPREVCIVLDDVHEVPPDSGGALLLTRLTTDL